MRRAHKCTAGDIPQAPAVFVEVTRPPKVQGQDVWPVAPSNMWQAEHAAVMCKALQGQAAALPTAPAAQSSGNGPTALLALLHSVSRAWCWVVVALEPNASALCLYDRGEGTVLTVRPADLEALHLGALSGDGGTALYLQGIVVGSAAMRFRRQSRGDGLRLIMAENMGPWLRAFSTSRWKVEGDREKFADAWRRWVEEQFPVGGMLHLPQPPGVPPVQPAAPPAAAARPAPRAAPKPSPKRSPPPQYGSYANIRYVLRHFGGDLATEQRGSKVINVCPWSRLDGAGHCSWKAGKHCRPTHLHPMDLLDHLQRDHGAGPAQRQPGDSHVGRHYARRPGGAFGIGPGEVQSARDAHECPPCGRARSVAVGGTAWGSWVCSTAWSDDFYGERGAGTSSGGAAGAAAASAGSKSAAATSSGDPRGRGPSRQQPAPGADGPPPFNDPDLAGGHDPKAQP